MAVGFLTYGGLEYQPQHPLRAQNRASMASKDLRAKKLTQACYLRLFFISQARGEKVKRNSDLHEVFSFYRCSWKDSIGKDNITCILGSRKGAGEPDKATLQNR